MVEQLSGRRVTPDAGHAQVGRPERDQSSCLGSFVLEESKGQVDAFEFAEPAFCFGSGAA
jgi:hypothetical protein